MTLDSSPDFGGLRVAAFESRRADEMARMIERHGGIPSVSPSMREVPLEKNAGADDFAQRTIAGEFDVVVFMTGVGIRHLLGELSAAVSVEELVKALARTKTVARGPKPVAVLRELGITPTYRAAEPNTWREVVAVLEQGHDLRGQRVAIQEYGATNVALQQALRERGAVVTSLSVYRWELPEDLGPLEANIRAIAAGEREVVLFLSSQQVVNALAVAERLGLTDDLLWQMARCVVGSIGPTTSETLRERDLPVDFEPQHSKMGHLVQSAAAQASSLLARKRGHAVTIEAARSRPSAGAVPAWQDSRFLRACRREAVDCTPIWLMRQAGRYLPEYREVRSKVGFLELCKNPQLSAEVMVRTVERLGVDAAIIFSDLLPILEPMGLSLEFAAGEGPVIHNPVREGRDVQRVRELEGDLLGELDFVYETVRATRAMLPEALPVIGFAGAPFTLASYIIEGGSSRHYAFAKGFMYRDPGAWHELLARLSRSVARYLIKQIEAGAQAVQIFDSWVGCLGPEDYRRFVLPHTQSLIKALPAGFPVINFATGNPALIPLLSESGGSVIGLDWRVSLAEGWKAAGYDRAVQGNLDPMVLLSDPQEIRRRAQEIIEEAGGRAGHIFNLGHGILPQTAPENVIALVEAVHELSAR